MALRDLAASVILILVLAALAGGYYVLDNAASFAPTASLPERTAAAPAQPGGLPAASFNTDQLRSSEGDTEVLRSAAERIREEIRINQR